jgi:hypothetical protein
MIEKLSKYQESPKRYLVTCDTCGDEEIILVDDWDELMEEMNDSGWISINTGEDTAEWVHKCSDCATEDD